MKKNLWQRLQNNQQGTALIELAAFASLFAVVLPALFDLSLMLSARSQLAGGMRGGMEYAMANPTDTSGIQAVVQATSNELSGVTVATSTFCDCSGLASTCGDTCADGTVAAQMMTITATYSVPLLFNYFGTTTYELNEAVTLRYQ